MTKLKEKLQDNKIIKDNIIKTKGGYGMNDTPHLLEVLEYLKQYRAEKKRGVEQTVYNRELVEYITEKENIPQDLQDILEMQVYFAQSDYRDNLEAEYKTKMLEGGWLELKNDITYRGKIEFIASRSMDWFTQKLATMGKIIETNDGKDLFIIPKGNRSRGYYVRSLEKAFYKPVLK